MISRNERKLRPLTRVTTTVTLLYRENFDTLAPGLVRLWRVQKIAATQIQVAQWLGPL